MSLENPITKTRTYNVDDLSLRLSRLTGAVLPEEEITESFAVISEVDPQFIMDRGLWFMPNELDVILSEYYSKKQIPFVKKDLAYYVHTIASYILALEGNLVPELYNQKHVMWQETLASCVESANNILMGKAKYPEEPVTQDIRVFTGTDAERDALASELTDSVAVLHALKKHRSDGSIN